LRGYLPDFGSFSEGAIMSIGIASANSILVVSFARERLAEGMAPLQAEAGTTRFRPVLMTAARHDTDGHRQRLWWRQKRTPGKSCYWRVSGGNFLYLNLGTTCL